jgi:predicted amidophosphoribosyltransferase
MNPIDRELCIDCGEKLPAAITCAGCNNMIPGDAKFCPVCGKPQ